MFTQQHYEMLAEILSESRHEVNNQNYDWTEENFEEGFLRAITIVESLLAIKLLEDNPRFNSAKFLLASNKVVIS
jgi:hypothetical protein